MGRVTAAETPAEDENRPADRRAAFERQGRPGPSFARAWALLDQGPVGRGHLGNVGAVEALESGPDGVSVPPGRRNPRGHPERWPLLAGPRTPGLERRARARALRPAGPAVIGLYPPARCHRIDFRSLG